MTILGISIERKYRVCSLAGQFGLDLEAILTTSHAYFNATMFSNTNSFTRCACTISPLPIIHQMILVLTKPFEIKFFI